MEREERRMKVYVVDDSPLVRERLVSLLSEVEGVDVVGSADDAATGIAGVSMKSPDVVILDIRMPSGSGISVLEEVKRRGKSPVVVMLTNYPYPQYRKKCMEAGADYFFDKSNGFHKVTEVLARMIADGEDTWH
jgi:DNA-binding NarL/FixJ family response regulator